MSDTVVHNRVRRTPSRRQLREERRLNKAIITVLRDAIDRRMSAVAQGNSRKPGDTIIFPPQPETMSDTAILVNQLLYPDPSMLQQYQAQQQQNALGPGVAGSLFDRAPQNAPGLLAPGNINIHQRPVVHNANGSISTVRSMTFADNDGSTVVVPSVIAGRGIVGPDEAFKYYQQTGQFAA